MLHFVLSTVFRAKVFMILFLNLIYWIKNENKYDSYILKKGDKFIFLN